MGCTLKQIIEDYDGMLRDCAAQYQLQEEELQKKQRKVARTQESCDKQKETAEKLFAESRRLYDRAKLLEDLERNLEGFIHSVKIDMRADANTKFHITVDKDMQKMVLTPTPQAG